MYCEGSYTASVMLWDTHAMPQAEVARMDQRSHPGSVQQVWALPGMGIHFTREMGKAQGFGSLVLPRVGLSLSLPSQQRLSHLPERILRFSKKQASRQTLLNTKFTLKGLHKAQDKTQHEPSPTRELPASTPYLFLQLWIRQLPLCLVVVVFPSSVLCMVRITSARPAQKPAKAVGSSDHCGADTICLFVCRL